MRIYEYGRTKGYEMLLLVDDDGSKGFDRLNGKLIGKKKWKPIRVRRVRATRREAGRPSDAPYVFSPGVLVFRRSAVDALRDILDAYGELLPLEDEGGVELFAYNPRALEALDHERTQGSRDEHGRVYLPNNHVFFPSVVEGVDIFRQSEKRTSIIFVGERFIQRWKQAKLKGLDFKIAWDSDLPPEAQPNVWTSKPIKL
jgi:hypothetical protein